MKNYHELLSRNYRASLTLLLAMLCLLMVLGCSESGDYPDLYPVSGLVTMDDKPLVGARVSFLPEAARPSSGTTDASGRYQLQYTGDLAGAVVGQHQVSISKPEPDPNYTLDPSNEDDVAPELETIPERYRGVNSELTAEVTSGDNTFDFKLTSD